MDTHSIPPISLPSQSSIPLPTLSLNVDLYQHYLEDANLTDTQKLELLQTLWSIICEFVFLGFGVTSTQQVLNDSCGQGKTLLTSPPETHAIGVESTTLESQQPYGEV
jgi:hypothetical protein